MASILTPLILYSALYGSVPPGAAPGSRSITYDRKYVSVASSSYAAAKSCPYRAMPTACPMSAHCRTSGSLSIVAAQYVRSRELGSTAKVPFCTALGSNGHRTTHGETGWPCRVPPRLPYSSHSWPLSTKQRAPSQLVALAFSPGGVTTRNGFTAWATNLARRVDSCTHTGYVGNGMARAVSSQGRRWQGGWQGR